MMRPVGAHACPVRTRSVAKDKSVALTYPHAMRAGGAGVLDRTWPKHTLPIVGLCAVDALAAVDDGVASWERDAATPTAPEEDGGDRRGEVESSSASPRFEHAPRVETNFLSCPNLSDRERTQYHPIISESCLLVAS